MTDELSTERKLQLSTLKIESQRQRINSESMSVPFDKVSIRASWTKQSENRQCSTAALDKSSKCSSERIFLKVHFVKLLASSRFKCVLPVLVSLS